MTSPQDGSGSPKPPSASVSSRGGSSDSFTQRLLHPTSVIIVTSVMFTFISYWRTAAVVLCDLASTAYYIGAIVEESIGPAAPWFILAVMIFSYAVRSVYIESCSMFVRGGVYRVVREALGKFMAKLAVSALMFDYVLTGPISGVSAGQYVMGLILDTFLNIFRADLPDEAKKALVQAFKPYQNWGAVLIASGITLYFFRQNLIGIHESSEKAMRIMIVTTIMAALLLGWCGVTLIVMDHSKINPVPIEPHFPRKGQDPSLIASAVGQAGGLPPLWQTGWVAESILKPPKDTLEDPLGFIRNTSFARQLRQLAGQQWFSLLGFVGIMIAFGHSILAMSGEETLAQVYREVESPKLKNFRKAAFVVFLYSIVLTAGISFLAVMLIPQADRVDQYKENLLGGLAMNVVGPSWARLLLNAFVVVVGSLILAGAVNTAIIGSNGVLNRVAEDGVIPDAFLKPHPRYGTTYRILYLIVGLQLFTIFVTGGNVILLGEAYAFGVVWSFVFQALAMVVLRFKDPRPREAKVPLNVRVGRYEVPVGLLIILFLLLVSALLNLITKAYATIGGVLFTMVFFAIFYSSERVYERKRKGLEHEHLEQFNKETSAEVTPDALGLSPRLPQAGGHPLGPQPVHAGARPGGDRSGDDQRGGDDRQAVAGRLPAWRRRRTGHLRPATDDRRGHPRREGRQGGQAADCADQQPAARCPQHRPRPPGPRAGHGGVQQVHRRRAAGAGRLLLDQPARRQPGPADRAHPDPGPRAVPGPGRRQSHSPSQ